jgi:DnaJ-class molecular chaperone
MTGTPCGKCGGSGLITREGDEAKADLHPQLSQEKALCDKCGGSGTEPKPHAANVNAAKGQCG